MSLEAQINDQNSSFCLEHNKIILNLVIDALENESEELSAPEGLQAVLGIGKFDAGRSGAFSTVQRCYSQGEVGRVSNYFQFLNSLYVDVVKRTGAVNYKEQEVLEDLQQKLEVEKVDEFDPLSLSTIVSLEAIMEYDNSVIEAQSKQKYDKQSFTSVREVTLKSEKTNRKLVNLTLKKGIDAQGIYEALKDLRLRIHALERQRHTSLRQAQKKVLKYFEHLLDSLEAPFSAMVAVTHAHLPEVEKLEDIALVDKRMIAGVFYKILAADKTILPHVRQGDSAICYPMPILVLLPLTGYIAAATSLMVEKFRQNVIFFPTRCLEDPVGGLTRELLKLKKKNDHRREVMAMDAYRSFILAENLLGGSYEVMYEKFLRFCLGQQEVISQLTADERRILGGHFMQGYTTPFFITPEVWPMISKMKVGNEQSRADFNKTIISFRDDSFTAGVLHADRALQYQELLGEYSRNPACSDKIMSKYKASSHANRSAAQKLFKSAYKRKRYARFALFNMAVLLSQVPDIEGTNLERDLESALKLFFKSRENSRPDLWTYLADRYIGEVKKRIAGKLEQESKAENIQKQAEESFVSWIKGKVKKALKPE